MNIKLKGSLRTEKLTLNILLAIGIIAFCISLVIEFIFQNWMCYSTYHKLHLNYIGNVMLGVAGSSAISYISLLFSFINKKNNQISSVFLLLRRIYKDYTYLYNLVYYKANSNVKEQDYYLERSILEKANKLKKTISDVSTVYSNSEIFSEKVNQIIVILQHEVMLNLCYVTTFCEFLLLDLIYSPKAKERSSQYNNSFLPDALIKEDIELGNIPRDAITRRAENECYQFLLKTINSKYSIDEMDALFKGIEIKFGSGDVVATINELLEATHGVFNITDQFATQTLIRSRILEIRNKHEREYFSERHEMHYRMNTAMQKINDTLKSDPCFTSKCEQFWKLFGEDRLKEAEEVLLEIENEVPSE